jgi:hypothetical protein
MSKLDVDALMQNAIKHFWRTRAKQHKGQGAKSGRKDAGTRGAVTGGKHADEFVRLIAAVCQDAGLPETHIHQTKKNARLLPGFFRPCKEWDLIVTSGTDLVAVVEVKSQVGSFGNNFNNRVEEAVGNATDFWTAYREGRYKPSQRPWLGYLFMLQDVHKSSRPTKRVTLQHYQMDEEFQCLSYAKRYELVCLRLVRERLYDAACFCISEADSGAKGRYLTPNEEVGIKSFCISLHARAAAFAIAKKQSLELNMR